MKPCTGREGCLLQTQLDDEMESCRKMVIQGEDLETVKETHRQYHIHTPELKVIEILIKTLKMEKNIPQ